jgi:hypothetical protein
MAKEPFTAILTSEWIGGLFYWVLKGFTGKFTDQLTDNYKNRNFVTGYAIYISASIGLLYIIFVKNP